MKLKPCIGKIENNSCDDEVWVRNVRAQCQCFKTVKEIIVKKSVSTVAAAMILQPVTYGILTTAKCGLNVRTCLWLLPKDILEGSCAGKSSEWVSTVPGYSRDPMIKWCYFFSMLSYFLYLLILEQWMFRCCDEYCVGSVTWPVSPLTPNWGSYSETMLKSELIWFQKLVIFLGFWNKMVQRTEPLLCDFVRLSVCHVRTHNLESLGQFLQINCKWEKQTYYYIRVQ